MNRIALFLLAVFAFLQYELWLGDGGWRDRWSLEQKLEHQIRQNRLQAAQNTAMRLEVENLKQGGEALNEAVRNDFGYVRDGEIFYRIPTQ
ncbi:MAG: septum formation initiator family protein [Neisseria sp.]|nr:septum formation initiator family protein [Neisseria sp.]